MNWWPFKSDSERARDELVELSRSIRDVASENKVRVGSLEKLTREFEEHRLLTTDQYTSAYARTAEVHFEHSVKELEHRKYIDRELQQRWREHTESMQEQIGQLKAENTRLINMHTGALQQCEALQKRLDDTPRIHQIRDWMIELMRHFKSAQKRPPPQKNIGEFIEFLTKYQLGQKQKVCRDGKPDDHEEHLKR